MKTNNFIAALCCLLFSYTISAQVTVSTSDMTGEINDQIDIPVVVNDWQNVVSAQFSVNYNPDVLEFMFVHSLGLPDMTEVGNFGTPTSPNPTPEGIVTFSWYDPSVSGVSVNDGNSIFILKLKVIGEGDPLLAFTGEPTAIEIMHLDGNELDVDFEIGQITVDGATDVEIIETADFALHANQPNPFKEATTIRFDLNRASQTTLSIYNTAGKLLHQDQAYRNTGTHTIQLAKDLFPAAGTYFYRLSTETASATRKMTFLQ